MIKKTITAAFVALLMMAAPAHSASPVYMKNHPYSVANVSISTTNPPTSGNIYSVKPGYAATGLCFYASASKLTMYWLGNGSAKTAPAGRWTCPAYSNSQYTIRVYN